VRDVTPEVKRVRGVLKEYDGTARLTFSLPGARRGRTRVSLEGRRVRVEGKGKGLEYSGVRLLPRTPRTVAITLMDGEVSITAFDQEVTLEELQRVRAERDELKRRLQGLQRDVEILRKRSEDERERLLKERTSQMALKVIEVLDSIERALLSAEEGAGLREGIEILRKQVQRILKSMGVEEIEAEGQVLDPLYHHAVKTVVDPGREEDTVVEVLQKGYTLDGEVIRPAMVVVSKREGGDDYGKGAGN